MSFASPLNTLTNTTLWKHLNEAYANTPQHELAAKLAIHTKSACEDARERIKRFPISIRNSLCTTNGIWYA